MKNSQIKKAANEAVREVLKELEELNRKGEYIMYAEEDDY